jgi:hypothetical protein
MFEEDDTYKESYTRLTKLPKKKPDIVFVNCSLKEVANEGGCFINRSRIEFAG